MNSLKGAMAALLFAAIISFLALLPDLSPLPEPAEAKAGQEQPRFHDIGYENAWVQFVDRDKGLVQVQTVGSRIVIVFRPKKRGDLSRYRVGWVAPVTFRCRDNSADRVPQERAMPHSENCDIGSQLKTYVSNAEVEPTTWKVSGDNRRLQIKAP